MKLTVIGMEVVHHKITDLITLRNINKNLFFTQKDYLKRILKEFSDAKITVAWTDSNNQQEEKQYKSRFNRV